MAAISIIGLFLAPSNAGVTPKPKPRRQIASWAVDLRSLGYTGPPRTFVAEGYPEIIKQPLCFVDETTLVATFFTRERAENLAQRGSTDPFRPLRLHAVFLDARTGEVRTRHEWATPSPAAGVVACYDGRIVLRIGERITLYSKQLEPIAELVLPSRPPPQEYIQVWNHLTSPNEREILLFDYSISLWIDSDNLEIVRTWEYGKLFDSPRQWGWPSISSNSLARAVDRLHTEIWLRPLDGPWRKVCGPPVRCGEPHFVSNDLFVSVKAQELSLIRTDGRVVFAEGFDGRLHLKSGPHSSADGNRFAVALFDKKGGNAFLDIMPAFPLNRVMVYDIPAARWVYTLDAKPLNIDEENLESIALSPDGSLLAIMGRGIVKVYEISAYDANSP